MTNYKFITDPDLETYYSFYFDYISDTGELQWCDDSITMVEDLQATFKNDNWDLIGHQIFENFYNEKIDDIKFFELLEIELNKEGLFTYNSASTFHIYTPDTVDLTNANVTICLSKQ